MLQTRGFTIGGYRTKGHQDAVDDQDDIGPRMADDIPFAMIELLGVFRMQTGTMLECALHQNRDLPGETFHVVKTLCTLLGWGYPLNVGQFACHRHYPKTSGVLATVWRG